MIEKLYKQTRLPTNQPYSIFSDMFQKEKMLFPVVGFEPLIVTAKLIRATIPSGGRLKLERAAPPIPFTDSGMVAYETEGIGGKLLQWDSTAQKNRKSFAGLTWLDTLMVLVGDTSLISGTIITIPKEQVEASFIIYASGSNFLKENLFRLRRVYDTLISAEILGASDGSTVVFSKKLTKLPCPCSIKVTFEDAGGAKTDLVRDNGLGKFTTLTPDVLIEEETSINYATGEVVVRFVADHVPTVGNVTIAYEHSSEGEDRGQYDVTWEHGNG